MKKLPLILVEWDDPAGYKTWRDEEDVKETTPTRCITVGWKMKSDRKLLRIASTRSEIDQCVDLEIIPRGCVKSIRRLE